MPRAWVAGSQRRPVMVERPSALGKLMSRQVTSMELPFC